MATNDKYIDGRRVAKVYVWWDDELVNNNWRYEFTEVDGYDHIDYVLLPKGFDLYTTTYGEVLAYETSTEPLGESEVRTAWYVYNDGARYHLCAKLGHDRRTPGCTLIETA